MISNFAPIYCLAALALAGTQASSRPEHTRTDRDRIKRLRLAVLDLVETYGPGYPRGREFLSKIEALERKDRLMEEEFRSIQREALLADPALDDLRIILVRRRLKGAGLPGQTLGMPSNHECNSSLPRQGYDNEIAVLSSARAGGTLTTLYRPPDGGYAGEIDLHWNADRMLFTRSDRVNWKICEIRPDGSGLRQVSRAPDDVDCFDPCYLPDGGIVLASTACFQSVPCWHGQRRVANLYRMETDGSGMRQLCFDQDHDFHPCVLPTGQVIYLRWDYTGINHVFLRQLMAMNPDGTGQRSLYGSNSWFPNSLFFPRPVPGRPGLLVAILSGYHGVHRMGQLVLVDIEKGWHEENGLVLRISGRGDTIRPDTRDRLVDDDWPKFLHPFPLGEKRFLVAACPDPKSPWGIYYADAYDNLVLIREEPGSALLEPVPLRKQPMPPVIPAKIDPSRRDATVYLHDVYAGPGLRGVPRGTVKGLRLLAYHFGYPGLAGPDLVGRGGPWEVMRVLGTVPLDEDGSAHFRVPAGTPLAVQALDAEGAAVQLMRSWFTAMPGEYLSCVGCHESPNEAAPTRTASAALREPVNIVPWRGPPRGFSFAREVQPVIDRYCVSCHDGRPESGPDLRPADKVPDYKGLRISKLGVERMHPDMKRATGGVVRYTPAYEALAPYIRRVGIEDDVSLLVPAEYHADTSPLVQMLRKGHQGVRLDAEAWDRLITWIDLNAPCHGTWGEIFPIPDRAHERRMALRRSCGGPDDDPEAVPGAPRYPSAQIRPEPLPPPHRVEASGWPISHDEARRRQAGAGPVERIVNLGGGVKLKLVRIPSGEFVMGDADGEPDERPPAKVIIPKAFWLGACEVTNAQYRRFDPDHDPRYYQRRHARSDDRGLPLDGPEQPAVRVSWEDAMAFCRWLSGLSGMKFTLPTEAQWEYACRAGTATPLSFGDLSADFSAWANAGDKSFAKDDQETGAVDHLVVEGAALADGRFNDGAVVTSRVNSYRPNAWGLHDMHGNAAEWTRTAYRPYPYAEDGRSEESTGERKIVRGGSFADHPKRCRSAFRLAYPPWRRIHNVGFRVACEEGH